MPDRDLFGNPVSPTFGRSGRPRFMPTRGDRALVRRLKAEGASQAAIAAALGITVPTLAVNFARELQSQTSKPANRAKRDRKLRKELR